MLGLDLFGLVWYGFNARLGADGGPEMTTDALKEILGKVTHKAARDYLSEEYELHNYPSYANLALNGDGTFTMCSIRAIENAQAELARRVIAADKLVEALLLLIGDMQSLDKEDWASVTIGLEYITEYEATK